MKFINTLLLVLFTFVFCCFSGCLKKGEDDPLISFRTRKSKLTGKWHLTSGTEERTSVSADSLGKHESKTTYTYKGSSYQEKTEENGVYQNSYFGSFSYSMEFKKDGGFSSEKTMDNPSPITALNGTWNFTKGIGEHKNKEQIVINLNSNATIYNSQFFQFIQKDAFTGNLSDITYTLKELRNKKLVIISEYSSVQSAGYGSSLKSELTFEQ